MLNIDRSRQVLAIALPIMAGMSSQSLLNLVDAAMVGSLGADALAAVGIGGYANFMTIAAIIGLGAGVQALVARRKGAERFAEMAIPLNSGLLLVMLFSLPVAALAVFFADELMRLLLSDQAVSGLATDYYLTRVAGIFAVGANFAFRGYWNGTNRSGVYMRTLIAMHLFNVVVSYGLIFGAFGLPELGAIGAGIGTTLALYFGSLLYFWQTWRVAREHGFLNGKPAASDVKALLRLAAPNSLQQFLFAAGLTVLFTIIGMIGTDELAVAHVLITLVLFLILPAIGLGMSATSLVGQAMGRNAPDDAYRWGWDVTRLAVLLLLILALPMWFIPDLILGLFLSGEHLIELGRIPLTVTGIAVCLDGIAITLTNSLIGAGATRQVMLVTLGVQWLLFLPAAWLVGPWAGYGLLAVWFLQAAQRLITSGLFAWLWYRRQWQAITL